MLDIGCGINLRSISYVLCITVYVCSCDVGVAMSVF